MNSSARAWHCYITGAYRALGWNHKTAIDVWLEACESELVNSYPELYRAANQGDPK